MNAKQKKLARFMGENDREYTGYINHDNGHFWASDGYIMAWYNDDSHCDGFYDKNFNVMPLKKAKSIIPIYYDAIDNIYCSYRNKAKFAGELRNNERKEFIRALKLIKHVCQDIDGYLPCMIKAESGKLTIAAKNGVVYFPTTLHDFGSIFIDVNYILKILRTHTGKSKVFVSNEVFIMESDNWHTIQHAFSKVEVIQHCQAA